MFFSFEGSNFLPRSDQTILQGVMNGFPQRSGAAETTELRLGLAGRNLALQSCSPEVR